MDNKIHSPPEPSSTKVPKKLTNTNKEGRRYKPKSLKKQARRLVFTKKHAIVDFAEYHFSFNGKRAELEATGREAEVEQLERTREKGYEMNDVAVDRYRHINHGGRKKKTHK